LLAGRSYWQAVLQPLGSRFDVTEFDWDEYFSAESVRASETGDVAIILYCGGNFSVLIGRRILGL